jgi:antitoxin VapB
MALTVKNPEVERLVNEVSRIAGETKTEAVRRALVDRRLRLVQRGGLLDRRTRIMEFLESELWPLLPPSEKGQAMTDIEIDVLLGREEGAR